MTEWDSNCKTCWAGLVRTSVRTVRLRQTWSCSFKSYRSEPGAQTGLANCRDLCFSK